MSAKELTAKILYPLSVLAFVLALLMVYDISAAYDELSGSPLNFLGLQIASPYMSLVLILFSVGAFVLAFLLSGGRLYEPEKMGWQKKIEANETEQKRRLEEQERLKNEEYARAERQKRITAKVQNFIAQLDKDAGVSGKEEKLIRSLCNELQAVQGIFYTAVEIDGLNYLEIKGTFAYHKPESQVVRYEFGEGLCGQVAKEGKQVVIKNIPEGYVQILSGLGQTSTAHLLIAPLINTSGVKAVIEIASFSQYDNDTEEFISLLGSQLAERL